MKSRRKSLNSRFRALLAAVGTARETELTDEARAAFDARDRALLTRFLARDPAAEREVVARLNSLGWRVSAQFWPRLFADWEEHRGEYFATLHRYREEGKLRLDEPLRFLAQRLLKHVGRKTGVEAHRDQMALSLQGKAAPHAEEGGGGPLPAESTTSWAVWLEGEASASIAAQPRFVNAETLLATREIDAQLAQAVERLAPMERATFEAERAVANGEHESLAVALGVSAAAARQRRSRMRKALRRIAEEMGADDLLERIGARMSHD